MITNNYKLRIVLNKVLVIKMSTNWISKQDITRDWLVIDAKGIILGRLASYLAFYTMLNLNILYQNLDCKSKQYLNMTLLSLIERTQIS